MPFRGSDHLACVRLERAASAPRDRGGVDAFEPVRRAAPSGRLARLQQLGQRGRVRWALAIGADGVVRTPSAPAAHRRERAHGVEPADLERAQPLRARRSRAGSQPGSIRTAATSPSTTRGRAWRATLQLVLDLDLSCSAFSAERPRRDPRGAGLVVGGGLHPRRRRRAGNPLLHSRGGLGGMVPGLSLAARCRATSRRDGSIAPALPPRRRQPSRRPSAWRPARRRAHLAAATWICCDPAPPRAGRRWSIAPREGGGSRIHRGRVLGDARGEAGAGCSREAMREVTVRVARASASRPTS